MAAVVDHRNRYCPIIGLRFGFGGADDFLGIVQGQHLFGFHALLRVERKRIVRERVRERNLVGTIGKINRATVSGDRLQQGAQLQQQIGGGGALADHPRGARCQNPVQVFLLLGAGHDQHR